MRSSLNNSKYSYVSRISSDTYYLFFFTRKILPTSITIFLSMYVSISVCLYCTRLLENLEYVSYSFQVCLSSHGYIALITTSKNYLLNYLHNLQSKSQNIYVFSKGTHSYNLHCSTYFISNHLYI